jgi:hypothetical protein
VKIKFIARFSEAKDLKICVRGWSVTITYGGVIIIWIDGGHSD